MSSPVFATAPFAREVLETCLAEAPVQMTVTGTCLSPSIREGDTVLLHGRRRRTPRWGDVVLCLAGGRLRLHRLVWSPPWGEWRTKGDHAFACDPGIRPDQVLGTVVAIAAGRETRPVRPRRVRAARSLASALLHRLSPPA